MTEDIAIGTLDIQARIDELEVAMQDFESVDCPLIHTFTDGMYRRQITMPKGSLITSKIHLTEHPFAITKGSVWVRINADDWEYLEAPYNGITKPGTRRVLYIEEECIWTTYHSIPFIMGEDDNLDEENKLKMVELIEDIILDKRVNPLLEQKQNLLL